MPDDISNETNRPAKPPEEDERAQRATRRRGVPAIWVIALLSVLLIIASAAFVLTALETSGRLRGSAATMDFDGSI